MDYSSGLRGILMIDRIGRMTILAVSVALGISSLRASEIRPQGGNLVENPGIEVVDELTKMPAGWRHASPREEISPRFEMDSAEPHSGKYALKITSKGSPGTFGYWVATVPVMRGSASSPENDPSVANSASGEEFLSHESYRFRCFFKTRDVASLSKSVVMRIRWRDEKGQELFGEYISKYNPEGDWYRAEQLLTAPRDARSADLEFVLQWTERGSVLWDDVSFERTDAPLPRRMIKVATVSYEPPAPSTPEKNLQFYAEKVTASAKAGADFICLGEGITVVSTGKDYADVAEPLPGPTSRALGELAKAYRVYIVAGIFEREGSLVYNTALLIGRNGEVVGKYRKTHLPETEVSGGVTPGDSYPVFRVDFGTIGLETCYDNFFPEVARALAVEGAEIIFLPIWGDGRSEGYEWDVVARSRAIDNAVYLVASNYSQKRSFVIDPNGRILADTGGRSGTAIAEVDLNARTFERWLGFSGFGEWKGLYPVERRKDTYGVLAVDANGKKP